MECMVEALSVFLALILHGPNWRHQKLPGNALSISREVTRNAPAHNGEAI